MTLQRIIQFFLIDNTRVNKKFTKLVIMDGLANALKKTLLARILTLFPSNALLLLSIYANTQLHVKYPFLCKPYIYYE